jgi:hypothetical protein
MRHAYREQATFNADESKSGLNQFAYARSVRDAFHRYRSRLNEHQGKIRSDAVMAVEYLITASPEFFEKSTKNQQFEYFNRSLKWLRSIYGAENIVSAGIHYDEKTPHLWCYVIPMKNNRLNAKFFIGGHKSRLSELQTDFHQQCCADLGLKRGVEKSVARHVEVRHWYTVMRQVLDLPKKTTAERIKAILGGDLDDLVKGAAANAAKAAQAVERAHRTIEGLKRAQNRAESVLERLATSEKLNRFYEAERAKQDAYITELNTLRELVSRNRELLAKAENLRSENKPIQPVPNPTVPPASASQLGL